MYNPEIIANELELKNPITSGQWLTCLCPFPHLKMNGLTLERHNSFAIHLGNGFCKCFACGHRSPLNIFAKRIGKKLSFKVHAVKWEQPTYDFVATLESFSMFPEIAQAYLTFRGVTNFIYPVGSNYLGDTIYFPGEDAKYVLIRHIHKENRWSKEPLGYDWDKVLYGENKPVPELWFLESTIASYFLNSIGIPTVATCGAYVSDWQVERALMLSNRIVLLPQKINGQGMLDKAGLVWFNEAIRKFRGRCELFAIDLKDKKDPDNIGEVIKTYPKVKIRLA